MNGLDSMEKLPGALEMRRASPSTCNWSHKIASTLALTLVFGIAGVPAPYVSANAVGPEVELADLLPANGGDGTTGYALYGIDPSDFSGIAEPLGDVNGDGIDDIAVSTLFASPPGRESAGESYVVFGRDSSHGGGIPAEFDLSNLLGANGGEGTAGFAIYGASAGDQANVVQGIGDLNGDGINDIAIGARGAAPGGRDDAGQIFIIFGRNTADADDFPAEFDLAILLSANGGDGSLGFVINGIAAGDNAGGVLHSAGDLNGDDVDDLLIGATLADPGGRGNAGEAYVVFGRSIESNNPFPVEFELSSLLPSEGGNGSTGFALSGVDPSDQAFLSMDAGGDVNGDGLDDFIVGSFAASPPGIAAAGEVYVVFGRDVQQVGNFPARFELAALVPENGGNGTAGFTLVGIDAQDVAGRSVAIVQDMNGDGVDEIAIGAPFAAPEGRVGAGQAYLVFGRNASEDSNFPARFELANLLQANGGDGSNGFAINGESIDDSSSWVNNVGDVNADGFGDLLIGARLVDPDGRINAGRTYIIYGKDTSALGDFAADFELSALPNGDGSEGFVLNGIDEGDVSGFTSGGAGDMNGDGTADIFVCAALADPGGRQSAGETYIVFGESANDTDNDGVADVSDNCVFVPNTDQRDSDSDGFGNLCDADFNDDCIVNVVDLGILRSGFFGSDPDIDLNGDGSVNVIDLGRLRALFFAPPGPSGIVSTCD